MRPILGILLNLLAVGLSTGCGNSMEHKLINAVLSGDASTVETLIAGGANPNSTDDQGHTALMLSVQKRQLDVARVLIVNGADVDAKRRTFGDTALMEASYAGNEECVRMLIDSGANVNLRSLDGVSPLMLAVIQNHPSIVSTLISKGADVNATDGEGHTPLRIARSKQHSHLIDILRQSGAKD